MGEPHTAGRHSRAQKWRVWLLLLLAGIILPILLIRCHRSASLAEPSGGNKQVDPDCRLLPQLTGEQVTPIVGGTPPPPVAGAGAEIKLSFSGGYLIYNYARLCNDELAGYIYADRLPDFSDLRTVTVLFDGEVIDELACGHDCTVRTIIPSDKPPGTYRLEILGPVGRDELRFLLQVVATPQP